MSVDRLQKVERVQEMQDVYDLIIVTCEDDPEFKEWGASALRFLNKIEAAPAPPEQPTDVERVARAMAGPRAIGYDGNWVSEEAHNIRLKDARAAIAALPTPQGDIAMLVEALGKLIVAVEFEAPAIRDGVDAESRCDILMQCALEARTALSAIKEPRR